MSKDKPPIDESLEVILDTAIRNIWEHPTEETVEAFAGIIRHYESKYDLTYYRITSYEMRKKLYEAKK